MRGARIALLVTVLALAVLGGWRAAGDGRPSLDEQVTAVATGLRCPACEGQSVAASESDLARQMRLVARQQLAQGRSPVQVRAWFAQRYGDGVLLDPPASGLGLVAFVVPVLALAAGAAVLARFLRGPGLRAPTTAGVGVAAVGALVVVAAVAGRDGGGAVAAAQPLPVASPGPSAAPSAALPLPAQAVVPSPSVSGAPSVPAALAALKAGRAADAERLAQAVLADDATPKPTRVDALLVLGLAQRALGDPAARVTLQTFLAQAPDHPAAAQVEKLLAGSG